MATSKRDDILHTAWRLLESQGYHATGINQIINESGVPKGSFYHYFPEGKEGLAIDAIEAIGDGIKQKFEAAFAAHSDCVAAVTSLVRGVAGHLEESGYRHGGPLTTIALETATSNERINQACQYAYNTMHQELVRHLVAGGFSEEDARELGTTFIASLEGGVLLSRTFHSTEPMEQIANQLEAVMRSRLPAF